MPLRPHILILSLLLAMLSGCATSLGTRSDAFETELAPTKPIDAAPAYAKARANEEEGPIKIKSDADKAHPRSQAEIEAGSGKFIDETAAKAATASAATEEGQITFNFENQPIQAVVQAILGSLLKENYTIAPGVNGNVTFSTSKPIRAEQAMAVLEMLLSWTNNTLVYKQGRYTVLPIKDAIPGNLTPRIAPPAVAKGYEVRVFPLNFVSPTEMAKLLKPYARTDAIVSADSARSMIVMAGTAAELANYQHTIEVFDVDWLKGMSVGVYTMAHVDVTKLMPQLDKIFGTTGESPLAGMFRFLPLEATNSVVVLTPRVEYLEQAEKWLYRLDLGGSENVTQLYVYDVKNVKAVELSEHLNEIFLGRSSGTSGRSNTSGKVAPGLKPVTIGGIGGNAGSSGNYNSTSMSNKALPTTAAATTSNVSTTGTGGAGAGGTNKETDIRITPVEENNQLLVMATPGEWDSILSAIRRLDISPLQVQIETRILEVNLTGDLEFGVQWYLAGLIGSTAGSAQANGNYGPGFTGNPHDRHRTALGGGGVSPASFGGTPAALFTSYLNKNLEVAINALETSGNTKVLSAPSLVVMNNQQAQINVGKQIPVLQTSIVGVGLATGSTGTTTGSNSNVSQVSNTGIGSVQYLNTGVILVVTPRVNPGGLVYLDISQEVSSPGAQVSTNGNPPINQRQLQTQVAVQSGQTVLLGGLISEDDEMTDSGIPGLNRIPILGRLFGTTSRTHNRTELIVLITPQVVANAEDARIMTDEYRSKFQSLAPLRAANAAVPPAPADAPPPSPQTPAKNDEPKSDEK